jgi:hypothetical protein
VLKDKVNILAALGRRDDADACAKEILGTGELAVEQRRMLHDRLIESRMIHNDWPGVEAQCRTALIDQPHNPNYAWVLIGAQLNQDRWDAAWNSYQHLNPEVHDPAAIRPWVDLHRRFGVTEDVRENAAALAEQFTDPASLAHLRSLIGPS